MVVSSVFFFSFVCVCVSECAVFPVASVSDKKNDFVTFPSPLNRFAMIGQVCEVIMLNM